MDDNDVLVSDDQEMGQMFNAFFATVFSTECQDDHIRSKTIFHGNEDNGQSQTTQVENE